MVAATARSADWLSSKLGVVCCGLSFGCDGRYFDCPGPASVRSMPSSRAAALIPPSLPRPPETLANCPGLASVSRAGDVKKARL